MKDLIYLSHHYGKDTLHVQAGGGNTSEKHENGTMTVKASGFYLKEVDEKKGFVNIKTKSLKDIFAHREPPTEQKYNELISTITADGLPRPSMESGFHAMLPQKYVLHTHNIFINILLCSDNGEPILNEIAIKTKGIILDYITPGIPLSHEIAKIVNPPTIIFLRNHGVIVGGDSVQEIINIYDKLNKLVLEKLMKVKNGLKDFPYLKIKPYKNNFISDTETYININASDYYNHQLNSILCPDQAIYFSLTDTYELSENKIIYKLSEKKSFAMEQMSIFIRYILYVYNFFQWEPRFISPKDVTKLLNLDSEKYRQSL